MKCPDGSMRIRAMSICGELFAELVREVFTGLGVTVPLSAGMLEMKTAIATQGEAWKQQWLAEGYDLGRF